MRFFEYQMKYKERVVFLTTAVTLIVFSIINGFLIARTVVERKDALYDQGIVLTDFFKNSGFNVLVQVGFSVFMYAFYIVIIGVGCYLVTLLLGYRYSIKVFFKLAIRVLLVFPIALLSVSLTNYEVIYWSIYAGFYICIFLSMFKIGPHYISLPRTKVIVFATIVTSIVVVVSFPYNMLTF